MPFWYWFIFKAKVSQASNLSFIPLEQKNIWGHNLLNLNKTSIILNTDKKIEKTLLLKLSDGFFRFISSNKGSHLRAPLCGNLTLTFK